MLPELKLIISKHHPKRKELIWKSLMAGIDLRCRKFFKKLIIL